MIKPALIDVQQKMLADFDSGAVTRGKKYHMGDKVKAISISNDGMNILSKVSGRGRSLYKVDIDIDVNKSRGITIDGTCSCYVGYNCKHVVATLFAANEQSSQALSIFETKAIQPTSSPGLNDASRWMNEFEATLINDNAEQKVKVEPHHLLYILCARNYGRKNTVSLEISLKISKLLKKGGYGKPKKYSSTAAGQQRYLQPIDEEIVGALQFIKNKSSFGEGSNDFLLSGRKSVALLEDILNTGRCFWDEPTGDPVKFDNKTVPEFKWELLPNGDQSFKAFIGKEPVNICVLDELLYIDLINKKCGIIHTDIPNNLIEKLLNAPPMPPPMLQKITKHIKSVAPQHTHLLPNKVKKPVAKIGIEPIPEMKLDVKTVRMSEDPYQYSFTTYECPTAEISFDYDGKIVPFSFHNTSDSITYIENETVYAIKRNFKKEKEHLVGLSEYMDVMDLEAHEDPNKPAELAITSIGNEDDFIPFVVTTLPHLEYKGWRIVRNHPAFAEVLHDEDISWYSELDEESEYDYFEFKMGIIIDGEKINILPIVAQLIHATNKDDFKDFADDDAIPLPLPNGKILSVPFARIKPILNTLIELYDTEWKGTDAIKLARTQAALLFEIQQAFTSAKLRWFGGEKLRKLGQKLAEFKSIKTVIPPKTFHATLRSYQQEGVNWLQFLREYQLNGILADDMGLGKTVQTLAHLSIEKNRRRMQKPTLIIAPTSLMTNWRLEAEQFTPNLKVLVYHGEDRHSYKNNITEYDVVLTTYPLLLRDKNVLLTNEFYYLILDEAQFIKNRKAKSTQIVHQIKAEHRLCLTGTPMENHLGELWSLFHFLMPGFLGEHLQFKRLFQTPIEKHNDADRQKRLYHRIKPFLLRRLKNEVVQDLPEKTEIIRSVELQGVERDLYESIRLSMEKKVVDAIKEKGLARSHIIILTALLKLRQVCCHPKLLKLSAAKKAYKNSAKMELLKEMLPNMVEEGRRILLFSQFTSMLELIEEMLKQEKINYAKLTGSTKNRSKPIESFQKGEVPIFLISLKAGGTGLNLTAADTVIHYDPWWNPAVEAQATDRAHRIGQKKAVFVYKLIASGTVEETIQEMQQKKKAIIEGLLSEKKNNKLKISSKDLEDLFKPLT